MTRYQVLRRIGLDPIASAFIAFINWLFGSPEGVIVVMHMTIEYDAKDTNDNP